MATGVDGRWHPGLGDPTVLGWVTVAAYSLGAALSLRAAMASRAKGAGAPMPSHARTLAIFWSLTAVTLLLLGINKQLDLQSWLTEVLRDLSRRQGWYEDRRAYQAIFVALLAIAGAIGIIGLAFALRRVLSRIGVALGGLGLLVTFVVVRAASFHHVDALLRSGPAPLNWVAELGSLILIGLNAWAAGRSRN